MDRDELQSMTVAQLKILLEENSLSKSGKKSDLIDRLLENLFSLDEENNMNHIKLANSCDAILIVPCTANFLSKMVNGSADDLATNVLLASDKVKIIAPAMNTVMWSNKIVKRNMRDLKRLGIHILNPQSGKLACGTKGAGKLMEVTDIISELNFIFTP